MIYLVAAATTITAATAAASTSTTELRPTGVPAGKTVFNWQDKAISESSGLAVRDDQMLTINDSGHWPIVYAAATEDGRTMASITFAPRKKSVRDVEALSFDHQGGLWVADIGDNYGKYRTYGLWHLKNPKKYGTVKQIGVKYRFKYPDGEGHDAEAFLIHPQTGMKYVVTKGIFGGGVYQLPTSWSADEVVTAKAVASTHGLITDGAFMPDGKHVLLRTYGVLTVHEYPSFRLVNTYSLPRQDQGEGMAVDKNGHVFLSTEGRKTAVTEVRLPEDYATKASVVRSKPTLPSSQSGDETEPTAPATLSPTPFPSISRWDFEAAWQQLPQAMQNKFVFIGAVCTAAVAAIGTGGFVWWLRRRRKKAATSRKGG